MSRCPRCQDVCRRTQITLELMNYIVSRPNDSGTVALWPQRFRPHFNHAGAAAAAAWARYRAAAAWARNGAATRAAIPSPAGASPGRATATGVARSPANPRSPPQYSIWTVLKARNRASASQTGELPASKVQYTTNYRKHHQDTLRATKHSITKTSVSHFFSGLQYMWVAGTGRVL